MFPEIFMAPCLSPRVIFLISLLIYMLPLSQHQIIFQRFKYFFAWSVSSRNQFLFSAESKPRKSSVVSLYKEVSSELEAYYIYFDLWICPVNAFPELIFSWFLQYFLMKNHRFIAMQWFNHFDLILPTICSLPIGSKI